MAPACLAADDLREDNDGPEEAVLPEPGSYADLRLVCRDDDWYAVDVCPGGQLDARLRFSAADGDLDLGVYLDGHGYLAVSDSTNDQESVGGTLPNDYVLYAVVYGYEGASNAYELTLELDCGG